HLRRQRGRRRIGGRGGQEGDQERGHRTFPVRQARRAWHAGGPSPSDRNAASPRRRARSGYGSAVGGRGMGNQPSWQWTATETARAIAAGEVKAEEVVNACLARKAEANPAINAVVVDLSAEAIAAARAADAAQAAGRPLGPLHGVPVSVKINVDVEGQANSNGVAALSKLIAPSQRPGAANFRQRGARHLAPPTTPAGR